MTRVEADPSIAHVPMDSRNATCFCPMGWDLDWDRGPSEKEGALGFDEERSYFRRCFGRERKWREQSLLSSVNSRTEEDN